MYSFIVYNEMSHSNYCFKSVNNAMTEICKNLKSAQPLFPHCEDLRESTVY